MKKQRTKKKERREREEREGRKHRPFRANSVRFHWFLLFYG